MAFVVDGSEWKFNGWNSEGLQVAIERFVENLERASARGETVWVGEDLQYKHVMDDFDIWRLREIDSPVKIEDEVWQELAAVLGPLNRYVEEPHWPAGFGDDFAISIAGLPPQENMDVSWAHHRVRAGQATGCIGFSSVGVKSTTSSRGNVSLHWINDSASHREFWRAAMHVEGGSPDTFRRMASHAYPDLYFCPGVLARVGDFNGGYYANIDLLKSYLGVFNDYGTWVFTAPPPALLTTDPPGRETDKPSNQTIEERFKLLGLSVAPEKPNVHKNATCREAREVTIGGAVLYCEWHGKLQKYQNRIHIHPPVAQSQNLLVIGKIADHLPLPGG
jgi:hypothetical protein